VRKARGFGGWGVSSGYWDFVFSEKEPVRLDGRGVGVLPERVRVWRFGWFKRVSFALRTRVVFSGFGWEG
jgi:hypothetical protein